MAWISAGLDALAVGAPRLDLDATLFIQMALFLGLWMLVRSRLVKPYLAARHEREALTSGARDEASALKQRADEVMSRYQSELQAAQTEASAIRGELLVEGSERGQTELRSAREAAQGALERSRAELGQEVASTRRDIDARSKQLADAIADKFLTA